MLYCLSSGFCSRRYSTSLGSWTSCLHVVTHFDGAANVPLAPRRFAWEYNKMRQEQQSGKHHPLSVLCRDTSTFWNETSGQMEFIPFGLNHSELEALGLAVGLFGFFFCFCFFSDNLKQSYLGPWKVLVPLLFCDYAGEREQLNRLISFISGFCTVFPI